MDAKFKGNPAERSKLLSLVEGSVVRLSIAALSTPSPGNIPLVTLLEEGLSELKTARKGLNKSQELE